MYVCVLVCVCAHVMQDSKWVEEKQNLLRVNQELREKVLPGISNLKLTHH